MVDVKVPRRVESVCSLWEFVVDVKARGGWIESVCSSREFVVGVKVPRRVETAC